MTMTQAELNEILEKHKKWLNNEPGGERADLGYRDLSGCNLRGSDLGHSDLRHSDLRGANLDYSCLPLWCGSLSAHFDDRQIVQIVYHAVRAGLDSPNVSEDVKAELRKMAELANRFHYVVECGRIEEVSER